MIQIKKMMLLAIGPLLTLLLSACTSNAGPQKTGNAVNTNNGFAVLELFTSEGCSSCPPAEKLLEQIEKETTGEPVYILAYHVDYWDRLGWKDVFSDHTYSDRQYEYSRHFDGQVYTPQLVFNGVVEGVGSDESFVRNTLTKMLGKNNVAALKINAEEQSGKLSVSYETKGMVSNMRLEIALVQKHAISNVIRGENKGRTLSHAQIVRSLSVFDLGNKTKGTETIQLPQDFDKQGWEIIGLFRNADSNEIVAASRSSINN